LNASAQNEIYLFIKSQGCGNANVYKLESKLYGTYKKIKENTQNTHI